MTPIGEITAVIGEMARGKFDQTLPVRSRDELGQAAAALNDTVHGIHERVDAVLHAVTAAAAGNLSKRVGLTGEDPIARIGGVVDTLVEGLRDSVAVIRDRTRTLSATADALVASSEELGAASTTATDRSTAMASSSEQIDRGIQSSASAMEQMGATSRHIAENTAEAARLKHVGRRDALDRRPDHRPPGRLGGGHRRGGGRDHGHREPNQAARPERDHRGRPRRRGRQGIRGRRGGDQAAGGADGAGHRADPREGGADPRVRPAKQPTSSARSRTWWRG